jgi:hypothetical protein
MIEIQYMVTEIVEDIDVASKLQEIETDDTKQLVRTKAVKEPEEQES